MSEQIRSVFNRTNGSGKAVKVLAALLLVAVVMVFTTPSGSAQEAVCQNFDLDPPVAVVGVAGDHAYADVTLDTGEVIRVAPVSDGQAIEAPAGTLIVHLSKCHIIEPEPTPEPTPTPEPEATPIPEVEPPPEPTPESPPEPEVTETPEPTPESTPEPEVLPRVQERSQPEALARTGSESWLVGVLGAALIAGGAMITSSVRSRRPTD
jgi:outer membrane biosynthesis protein TonB